MFTDLLPAATALAPRLVALRRAIHAEPELGLQTPLTLAKVREELADLPLDWREGTSATGAIAILTGGRPGGSVLLRGDMDALPMAEATGLPFASTIAGRMHACGHDAHTAMLTGAARLLAARQHELAGEVRFMFQPGEEGFHGARHMIEDGLLDPRPDAAFALHIMPDMPHGQVTCRPGTMMAAADMLRIVVTGRGGHASLPHQTRDPVPVAAEIITAIQALVTRRYSAAEATVITITTLQAGSAHNVIPNEVVLIGTVRTLSAERRADVRGALARLADGIAGAHDCTAEVTVTDGFPPTVNDPRAAALVAEVAGALPQADYVPMAHPLMGAEDFSYVLQQVPGAMAFLGVAPADSNDPSVLPGLHSTRMLLDEGALPRGAALLAGCALHFLQRGWPTGA
ncbi:amidohydrolase [Croceibacterium mercuriale]|uniref:Amidohydrolase n=1 Tax=Croceibacterium mercuriale TaxID=1572751 RepID=A0A0B2BXD3_9SPHN|nr:M20 family metallopeptidase [Croceibacterium mercuriale]KHL24657.1 amidohydrolase [Croceibacterium mercuriale]